MPPDAFNKRRKMNMSETLSIIGSICSVVASVASLLALQKVIKIGNEITVKGDSNVVVGGNNDFRSRDAR